MTKATYTIENCAICGAQFRRKLSKAGTLTCSLACGHELRRLNFVIKAQLRLGEPLREGIERRLAEGQHMSDIAHACGVTDVRNLYPIMDRLGIPRRSRAESIRLQWKDNEVRRAQFGQTISAWKQQHPAEAMAHSLIGNLALQQTSPTSIERRLADALNAAGISFKFQYVVGDKFLCDFAFPHAMLIVECDGEYWHSTPQQRKRDASKDAYLQACGYTVLRLSDKRIEQDVDSCIHAIKSLLQG